MFPILTLGVLTLLFAWKHRSAIHKWRPGEGGPEHRSTIFQEACSWRVTLWDKDYQEGKRRSALLQWRPGEGRANHKSDVCQEAHRWRDVL